MSKHCLGWWWWAHWEASCTWSCGAEGWLESSWSVAPPGQGEVCWDREVQEPHTFSTMCHVTALLYLWSARKPHFPKSDVMSLFNKTL